MTTGQINLREVERLNDAISRLRDAALKQIEIQSSLIYQLKSAERQRDQLLEALKEISGTNASKHGTASLMVSRCMDIANSAIAAVEAGK